MAPLFQAACFVVKKGDVQAGDGKLITIKSAFLKNFLDFHFSVSVTVCSIMRTGKNSLSVFNLRYAAVLRSIFSLE